MFGLDLVFVHTIGRLLWHFKYNKFYKCARPSTILSNSASGFEFPNWLIFKMRNRVGPSLRRTSKEDQVSSTSRHQLRPLTLDPSELFENPQHALSNIKIKFFINQLIKKIKYLTPPSHKPDDIVEEWENSYDDSQEQEKKRRRDLFGKQTLTEELSNRYHLIQGLEVLEGIFILVFCWIVTVSLAFQISILPEFSAVITFFIALKIIAKVAVAYRDSDKEESTYEIHWFEDFIEPFLLLVGAVCMLLRAYYELGHFQYVVGSYSILCVTMQWRKIGKYFQFLTIYAEQSKKRKQLRIIELFCFTLAMAHFFALILYVMTKFCPQGSQTWIDKASLSEKPWYILYIYSYYWANTTMVTVGYGDLTPNNFVEAIIVTLIQIVGTAIFGYMINVIGLTVNEIQKKNLQFQQHQSTIHKLQEHYQLSRELCYKMKSDIRKKESEMKEIPLKNNEEVQFLEYIDSSLREEFVLETNMKVIKKSIFFLTHFTVNFQNEIALKLIRCIYKPAEPIQIEDQDDKQLVIINVGKVNIYAERCHFNQDHSKLARVIQPLEGKPTLNVFGYSSLILNRKVNLKAVTQETSTAYILKRKDILECMHKSMLDFESFNQLRERMLQFQRLEEVEAPSLRDQEKHFLPNVYLMLKKIKYLNQERLKIHRYSRRMRRTVITLKHYQNKTLLFIPPSHQHDEEYDSSEFLGLEEKQIGIQGQPAPTNSKEIKLDQAKIFENFLKNFNVNIVSAEYERSCMRKSYRKRNRSFSKRVSTMKLV